MTTPTTRPEDKWVAEVARFYNEKRGDLPTAHEAAKMLASEWEELTLGGGSFPYKPSAAELKEICDVIYTAIGYGLARGYNVAAAFERVCASNMTKDGGLVDGKIQKGPGYIPPALEDLV